MKIVLRLFFISLGLCVALSLVARIVRSVRGPASLHATKPELTDASTLANEEDKRFDLIDMLPARAGDLVIIDATAYKGAGDFHLEPKAQKAIANYQWAREPGATEDTIIAPSLAMSDARIDCFRESSDHSCGSEGQKAMVGGHAACFYGPAQRCGDSNTNAILEIDGCVVNFRCDSFGKRTAADAFAVAEAVGRWASWSRGQRDSIPTVDVHANRARLLKARAVAFELERNAELRRRRQH